MIKKIFRKRKLSFDRPNSVSAPTDRPNSESAPTDRPNSDCGSTEFPNKEEGRCPSVETSNQDYLIGEKPGHEEKGKEEGISISDFSTEERPCYVNLDSLLSLDTVLSDTKVCGKGYKETCRLGSTQRTLSRKAETGHIYEEYNALQIQQDQIENLALQRWFYGLIGRLEAEVKLMKSVTSTFLVRESSRDNSLILSLKLLAGAVAHIRIEESGAGYCLEGSTKYFYTVGELITYFTHNEIVIKELGLQQLLSQRVKDK